MTAMAQHFDLIVIGSGPAGRRAAVQAVRESCAGVRLTSSAAILASAKDRPRRFRVAENWPLRARRNGPRIGPSPAGVRYPDLEGFDAQADDVPHSSGGTGAIGMRCRHAK